MRRAAARAASRLGSSTTIRPEPSTGSAIRRNGTTVVLPAPGGATSTAVPDPVRAATTSATTASTGRPVGTGPVSTVRRG